MERALLYLCGGRTHLQLGRILDYARRPESDLLRIDQSLTYFAYYIKKASYVDDATLKADDRALVEQQAASKGITFEEALRQRLECGQTEGRFEELDPDTDYFIYAYRMDETGRADGAVARSEFRTQPAPEELVRFTFSTPVLEYTRMTVVTEASEPEVLYCTDLMEAADYEALGGGEGAVLEYFRQVASYTASSGGMTVEKLVRAMSVQGTDEYTYEDLTQDTEYYAYAVVVDAEGNISDRCAFEKFRTPAVEASDMTIAIEVSNIKPDQADVTTTPDNDDEFYLVNLFYADELTKFSSDQEIIDAMIQKFGPSVDSELKFGTRTQTFYELAPDTEWVVLAFGYESGVNTTGLFRRNFRTPATGAVVDLDFEIEVVPHQFKAEATYKPSMESVRYAYEIMPEDTYNEYGADAAAIQRYYDELIARLIEQLPSLTVRDVVYQRGLPDYGQERVHLPALVPHSRQELHHLGGRVRRGGQAPVGTRREGLQDHALRAFVGDRDPPARDVLRRRRRCRGRPLHGWCLLGGCRGLLPYGAERECRDDLDGALSG